MLNKYITRCLIVAVLIFSISLTSNCFAITKTIYVATSHGLFISKDNGLTFEQNKTLGDTCINGVYVDKNNFIYTSTYNGLNISKNAGITFDHITTQDGLGSNEVRAVVVDNFGTIYAATANGLSIKQPQAKKFINKDMKDGLGGNYLCTVFVDKKGNVYTTEINFFQLQHYTNYTSIAHAPDYKFTNIPFADNVFTISATDDAKIYLTRYNSLNGLSISTDGAKSFTDYRTQDVLGHDDVMDITFDSANTIYGVSNNLESPQGGVFILKNGKFTFTKLSEFTLCNCIAVDNNGYIYVGAEYSLFISADNGKTFVKNTKIRNSYIQQIFVK